MSWFDTKPKEHLFQTYDWYDPKSEPVRTLIEQKEVTLSSFFSKIGDFFLSLK